jgi:eukaryotic-like serine/threonine-protein kinase
MIPSDTNAGNPTPASTINLDTEVGRMALESGLITKSEIEYCREQQKQSSDPNQRSLSDLLVENNFVTTTQVKRIRRQIEESSKRSKIPGYEIIREIGKGAMARVFEARQVSLDRTVAIKVLPRKMSENVEFVDRFYKEGKAAARLSHNNIVQAIDVGQAPAGYHYFVMEYIEGLTLYDEMAAPPAGRGRKFSEADALDVIVQICDALVHAHERGLIHRDVKPKNIILTPQGVAKLTDLGLARAADDTDAAESEAGKAYGTPYYISPEQIRGDVDIDFRADIYSLGATLYHLVTGRPPFEGDTPSAVMHKHLKQPLVPADHINTALSAGIGEIIDVAMAKKRDERYQSTADMLDDLKAIRRGEGPTHARRVIDIDSLAAMEDNAGKSSDTVDIDSGEPAPRRRGGPSVWDQPIVVALAIAAGASILANIGLIVLYVLK